MELQKLTEKFLQTISSLNRVHWPQELQENLKGEGCLLSYLESHHGESTPSDLCTALGVSAPRTAAMLRTLEQKGLLQRHADGSDKRRVVVTMTENGRRAAESRRQNLSERVRYALEQLGERDAREFIRILDRIVEIESLQRTMLQGVAAQWGTVDG